MAKGQSLVIQFVLFFTIGFSLFLITGNFFRYQSDMFRYQVTDDSLKLTSSYMSSAAITLFDSCKECDYASIQLRAENLPDYSAVPLRKENTTVGYPFEINLDSSGVNVSATNLNRAFVSPIHNIKYSISTLQGSTASVKTINLMFDRTKNELKVV